MKYLGDCFVTNDDAPARGKEAEPATDPPSSSEARADVEGGKQKRRPNPTVVGPKWV